jgi:hypothetical protein
LGIGSVRVATEVDRKKLLTTVLPNIPDEK